MSKPFLVAVIAVLTVFGAYQTALNYALRRINDDVAGKCLAPVTYVRPEMQA